VKLRLDVNGAWDSATAEARLRAVEEFDIEYVEQPLPVHDVDGLARLRRRVWVPIAADEAASSVEAVRALLAAGAVDALVVKLTRVGGPAAAAEIAEAAAEHGVPAVVSTLFETGVGIATALRSAALLPEIRLAGAARSPDHGLATAGLLEHDLLEESLDVSRGRMHTPGRAGSGGLGIVLDARALERFSGERIGSGA
jgi:O-succinylbenzoate synthase